MSKRHRIWNALVIGGIGFGVGLLAACSPDVTAPEFKEPTPTTRPSPTQVLEAAPGSARPELTGFSDTACIDCHSNQNLMQSLATEREQSAETLVIHAAPALEAWQHVWIDTEQYSNDVHSAINCTACHGGKNVFNIEEAHDGLIADPSDPAAGSDITCATCHTDIAPYHIQSLHYTRRSLTSSLTEMGLAPDIAAQVQNTYCVGCQATCGSCHISQPNPAGDGLLAGHAFVRTPPSEQTCAVCHGVVAEEFYGGEQTGRSIHAIATYCTDCHTGAEMHGMYPTESGDFPHVQRNEDGKLAVLESELLRLVAPEEVPNLVNHAYDVTRTPQCESCHQDVVGANSDIPQHFIHGTDLLACEACHTTNYFNCTSCHVDEALTTYTLGEASLGIYLGRNPMPSSERPYRYVALRHIPITGDTFEAFGSNVSLHATWVYATPHSIQRKTPQNSSCLSCHGSDAFFLTPDKVAPEELEANEAVVVEEGPAIPLGYQEYFMATEEAADAQDAQDTQEAQ
ncbi:MAG TPA: hypothetical protein VHP83_04830 [Aggregatilineaceae bacterium]|nr:hypothetical protein [Aggregatilineaceae bacterium]